MKNKLRAVVIFILGIGVGTAYHNDLSHLAGRVDALAHEVLQSELQDLKSPESNESGAQTIHHTIKAPQGQDKLTKEDTHQVHLVPESRIRLCFTPPQGCASLIADEINNSTDSIYMQAYGLTHPGIVYALIEAKKRGVDVWVLLDKSNETQKYSKMHELKAAGIEVSIDKVSGIAHNKVIILDKHKVVSGSFNFTTSADTRNAENVLIIDDENIASHYLQNWLDRAVANKAQVSTSTNDNNNNHNKK
jgi:phospholipase D